MNHIKSFTCRCLIRSFFPPKLFMPTGQSKQEKQNLGSERMAGGKWQRWSQSLGQIQIPWPSHHKYIACILCILSMCIKVYFCDFKSDNLSAATQILKQTSSIYLFWRCVRNMAEGKIDRWKLKSTRKLSKIKKK